MSKYLAELLRNANARAWPAVPQPTSDNASLQSTVEALKLRAETQGRETGNVLDSVVTVRDLIKLGLLDGAGIPEFSASAVKHNYAATAAPTVNADMDEGYSVGSLWFDVTNDNVYACVDSANGAAVWRGPMPALGAGTAGDLTYYNGTDWTSLAEGTEGQELYQGASSTPDWAWGGFRYIEKETPSGATEVDFTDLDQNSDHLFVFRKLLPANDNVRLYMRTSAGSGDTPTFDDTPGDYSYLNFGQTHTTTSNAIANNRSNSDNEIEMHVGKLGSLATDKTGLEGCLVVFNPGEVAQTYSIGQFAYRTNNDVSGLTCHMSYRRSAAVVQAVRFYMSAGDVASGTIEHWQRRVQ